MKIEFDTQWRKRDEMESTLKSFVYPHDLTGEGVILASGNFQVALPHEN